MVGGSQWSIDAKAMIKVVSHQIDRGDAIAHFMSALETGGEGAREQFITVAEQGDFFALGPEDATQDRLKRFRTGGLFPHGTAYERGKYRVVEVPYHADRLASVIWEHARHLHHPMVLLHEPYLTENDKTPKLLELTKIDDALYKVLPGSDPRSIDLVTEIHRFTVSWHALVILTEHEEPLGIRRIVDSAKLVAVGAYKGESYVYWLRRGPSLRQPRST
jgi:hypothetical protein